MALRPGMYYSANKKKKSGTAGNAGSQCARYFRGTYMGISALLMLTNFVTSR